MYGKTATSRFDVGGIMGRWFAPIDNSGTVPNYKPTKYKTVFSDLQNLTEGTVTIYGTVASTTYPFGSLDKGDSGAWDATDVNDSDRTNLLNFYRMNTGGIAGRFMDDTASHMVVDTGSFSVSNASVSGIYAILGSTVYFTTLTVSAVGNAVNASNGAQIIAGTITGTASENGLRATAGGHIFYGTNTLSVPAMYVTSSGGRILTGAQTSIPNY
jgi:hypothetical protein